MMSAASESKNNLLPVDAALSKGNRRGARIRAIWHEYWYLLLCMAIPAILFYLLYLARLIHPFGDGSVLVLDLNGQYVWFFEALRNFVKGDASLLYSFARAMGGEFLGIYAYYLSSPLSFLVCLFPTDRMLEGLLVLFLIKAALCGGTFGFYMHRTAKVHSPLSTVVFSILYALSSYGVIQQHNTMWIDAMIWLPLITLGIESLVRYGKYKLFTIFLAITLFSNFYIGYMVCIYCFFYFFLYYFGETKNNPNGERVHFVKSLLRMAFFSLLAIGIAMIILLGAYYSLSFGKTTFSSPEWEWALNFDILDLLYKFLPSSYDTVRPEGYPFVYCGILTLLLLPAYFLSKKYPMRQKICSAVFIFLFIASFSLTVIDLFWHGFQRPNWLNYRYSFMLCFYMCVLACRALAALESFPLRIVMGCAGLLGLLCVMLQKYTDEAYVDPNDYTCIWFTLIVIVFYLAILGVLKSGKGKQVACTALVVVVCAETFLNGLWCMNDFDQDVVYSKYSSYNDYLDGVRPIVDAVQESDTSFYRMEKTLFRKLNDNMALNIRGLSGSTSTLNQETIMFLQKMGYASQSHWSKYLGGTPVNDSLLGIKYIIADTNFDAYAATYPVYKQVGAYTAYKNPYALSLAYGVSDALLDFELGYVEATEETPEQSADAEKEKSVIGSTLDKIKAYVNQTLGIQETVRNAEYADPYYSPFERLNGMITAMLGESETVKVFAPVEATQTGSVGLPKPYYAENHACYNLSEGSKANLTFSFEAPVDGELYFYLPTNFPREVALRIINDTTGTQTDCGSFGSGESYRIVSLGMHKAGDQLSLRISLKTSDLYYVEDQPFIYYIDQAVFSDAMTRLASDQYQITDYTEDSFLGTFKASREHELVMTTLAYDEGWNIRVDGKTVSPIKALGSTLAFYVDGTAGQTHEIELVYRPKTLILGFWISVGAISFLVLLIVLEPILKRIPVLRGVVSIRKRKLKADTMRPKKKYIVVKKTEKTEEKE